MSKAFMRSLLVIFIMALILLLFGVSIYGPETGATIKLEEAGLIGALISALAAAVGYYLKD